jgi:hypothetical protein
VGNTRRVAAAVIGLAGLLYYGKLATQPEANQFTAQLARDISESLPGWLAIERGKTALVSFLGAMLVIAGLLVLNRNRVGRWVCLAYAPVAVLLHLGYLWYEFEVVKTHVETYMMRINLRLERMNSHRPPGATPPASFDAIAARGMVLGALVFSLHATTLAILLLLPNVGAACMSPPRGAKVVDTEGGGIPDSDGELPLADEIDDRRADAT